MVKISIITTCFNREETIQRTIDSVDNLIIPKEVHIKYINKLKPEVNPDEITFEHIIVDDGSTDNSLEIINNNKKPYRRVLIHENNKGVNHTRKTGITNSVGDYVLMLDSDDELIEDTLVKIVDALKLDPVLGKVFFFKAIDGRTKKSTSVMKGPYQCTNYKDYLEKKKVSGETMSLVRRDVYDHVMYFTHNYAFESMFWNRAIKKVRYFYPIPEYTRIYHTERKDRLCFAFHDKDNYKKRISDYQQYIILFQEDYLGFKLNKKLVGNYGRLAYYMCLNKQSKEARKVLRTSFKYKVTLQNIGLYLASFLGSSPFELVKEKVYGR